MNQPLLSVPIARRRRRRRTPFTAHEENALRQFIHDNPHLSVRQVCELVAQQYTSHSADSYYNYWNKQMRKNDRRADAIAHQFPISAVAHANLLPPSSIVSPCTPHKVVSCSPPSSPHTPLSFSPPSSHVPPSTSTSDSWGFAPIHKVIHPTSFSDLSHLHPGPISTSSPSSSPPPFQLKKPSNHHMNDSISLPSKRSKYSRTSFHLSIPPRQARRSAGPLPPLPLRNKDIPITYPSSSSSSFHHHHLTTTNIQSHPSPSPSTITTTSSSTITTENKTTTTTNLPNSNSIDIINWDTDPQSNSIPIHLWLRQLAKHSNQSLHHVVQCYQAVSFDRLKCALISLERVTAEDRIAWLWTPDEDEIILKDPNQLHLTESERSILIKRQGAIAELKGGWDQIKSRRDTLQLVRSMLLHQQHRS